MEQAVITLYLSVLTAIFHVNLVIQYQNGSILDFIGAKGDGGGGENWSYKTCHQQTNTQVFYRPDALPVTQPTTLKHWGKTCYNYKNNNWKNYNNWQNTEIE